MKYQYMPLFWGDFLANTLNLSAQEVGAYFLLIAHAWEHDGWIAYEHAQRIARISNPHWRKVRATLEPFFLVERDTDGFPSRYYHQRVRSLLSIADELSNKRKAAGLAGATKKHGKTVANRVANGVAKRWHLNKKDIESSFPLPRTRATSVDKSENAPAEPKQAAAGKKASEASRADLEAMFAAKRAKER